MRDGEASTTTGLQTMRVRKPTTIELCLQVPLACMLALIAYDFAGALSATSCFDPNHGPNCYPWGMTEGPMDGASCGYANKHNYLLSSVLMMAILMVAIAVPFLTKLWWQGVVGVLVALLLGAGALNLYDRVLCVS